MAEGRDVWQVLDKPRGQQELAGAVPPAVLESHLEAAFDLVRIANPDNADLDAGYCLSYSRPMRRSSAGLVPSRVRNPLTPCDTRLRRLPASHRSTRRRQRPRMRAALRPVGPPQTMTTSSMGAEGGAGELYGTGVLGKGSVWLRSYQWPARQSVPAGGKGPAERR